MSIPHVTDGETDLDSALFNPIIDRVNGLADGAAPIALAGIAGALAEDGRLANLSVTYANLRDYGGVSDSTTDNSPAFAEALSEAQIVLVPMSGSPTSYYRLTEPLEMSQNQAIIGLGGFQYPGAGLMTRIAGSFAGPLVTGTDAHAVTLRGIAFGGNPNSADSEAIEITNGDNWMIEDCSFNQFGGRAIHWVSGSAIRINKNNALNCMKVRTGWSDYTGVFDLNGADGMVTQNEVTASMASGYDTGYICALRHNGGNGFYSQNIWEISEHGVYIDPDEGYLTTFINDRADVNLGHGWIVAGDKNRFIGCRGYRNSQQTTDTYDHFRVTGTRNLFVACEADEESTDTKKAKYALNDQSGASGATLNRYALNEWRSYATAAANFSGSSAGYLDLWTQQTITGSSDSDKIDSIIAALVARGGFVDGTS